MLVDQETLDRIRLATGSAVVSAKRITDRGYSQNLRLVARFEDGATAFVKQAVDEPSAQWLRQEHSTYLQLRGTFSPRLLAWHDDGALPTLVLEDLSDAFWPPPWTKERVLSVLAALADVNAHPVPDGLEPASFTNYSVDGWPEVARAPEPLLSLGLCTPDWLERALPTLLAAADVSLLDGDALVHLDVRSDNLCLVDDKAVLIDWNLAAVGNPDFDIAFWLPSLRLEGGPEPEEVHDVPPGIVALVAGFFASRAGLPVIPHVPRVRDIQRRQLEIALPWVARSLGLPPPLAEPGVAGG